MKKSVFNQPVSTELAGQLIAYCVFDEKKIVKILSENEFDKIAEREYSFEGFSGDISMACVVINPNRFIQSIVLFTLPLDSYGFCPHGWRLPLQRLAHTASRGPSLGGGRIRLACYSQCSISSYQTQLWDPTVGHFKSIKRAIEKHVLKVDESLFKIDEPIVKFDNLIDQIHHLNQIKRDVRNESAFYRNEIQTLQQEVERQRLLNERLTKKISLPVRPAEVISQESKIDLQILRRQNEELSMKLQQLQISNEKLRENNKAEVDGKAEGSSYDDSVEKLINSMSQQDMVGVIYHHGAGHINLTPEQIIYYLDDPIAYVAKHIDMTKLDYTRWLEHEKLPECHVCDAALIMVTDPSVFNFDVDVYCYKHKP